MARHDLSGRNRLDWSSPGLRLFPGRAAAEKAATIATGGRPSRFVWQRNVVHLELAVNEFAIFFLRQSWKWLTWWKDQIENGSLISSWGSLIEPGQVKISSRVCSRFRPQTVHLLPFWKMDLSLPGVLQGQAVIVRQFEISSRVFSRFRPQVTRLLRFWKMDPS